MKRPKRKQTLGAEIIADLTDLRDTLRRGEAVEKRFTVNTVQLDLTPRKFDASGVRRLRASLGVSQAVFARILGVSTDLVASWEQGQRTPVPMACRLLELIQQDKARWTAILEGKASHRRMKSA